MRFYYLLAPCNLIQSWISDCTRFRFRIPGTGFRISKGLDSSHYWVFGILELKTGFQRLEFRVPEASILFLNSGIRIFLHRATTHRTVHTLHVLEFHTSLHEFIHQHLFILKWLTLSMHLLERTFNIWFLFVLFKAGSHKIVSAVQIVRLFEKHPRRLGRPYVNQHTFFEATETIKTITVVWLESSSIRTTETIVKFWNDHMRTT